MSVNATDFNETIVRLLRGGAIGVLRTDTLYGIVARAGDERAVEHIYAVKQRTPSKSPIVLIASTSQLFDTYDDTTLQRLSELWPGKNSVILPSTAAPTWIVRDNASVAYRIPDNKALRRLLLETGPLIAPSANPEGDPPAMSIEEAKNYFGNNVDFYVDGGVVTDDSPSKLYRLQPDGLERLR
jgi:L-threonylcarbamoyladenylate synthase